MDKLFSMDTIKMFLPNADQKIVKYIKIYFEGRFEVKGIGRFYFEQGRLRIPADATKEQYTYVTKINQTLKDNEPVLKW